MAATPRWKIYDPQGQYEAATKSLETAAAVVSFLGDGATIRSGHAKSDIVWTEGAETFPAGESYDGVRELCEARAEGRRPTDRTAYEMTDAATATGMYDRYEG